MTRKPRILAVCIGLLAALLLLLFHFKQRDTYKCASCHSKLNVYQWRLGMWHSWSVPLSPRWERVDKTQLRQHLFSLDHEHEWRYFQGSPYHFFGTTWGGCALGSSGNMNEFCQWYEMDPNFRRIIQTKIEDGRVSKETLQRIAELPPWHYTENVPDVKVSELIELAKNLIEEAGIYRSN